MQELADWLISFFNKRHLNTPDHWSIYEYHFSRDEFNALQSILCKVTNLPRLQLNNSIDFQRALFLYAVMWVSFNFKEGSPRWEDIFSSIQLPSKNDSFRTAETELVIKGAGYFYKQAKHDGHKYIGLIFSQAGLPIETITEASSTLAKRLQDVMGECLDFCVQGGFQGGSQSRLSFVYRGLKINDQRLRGTLSRRQKCAKRHAEGSIIPCIIPSRW